MLLVFYATGGRLGRQTLRTAFWGGVLFGLDIIFFFSAIKLTTVANATIVGALQPALLLYVGARWFGEQVNTALVGLTVVAISGAGIVAIGSASGGSEDWSLVGDLCALAGPGVLDGLLHRLQASPGQPQLPRIPGRRSS